MMSTLLGPYPLLSSTSVYWLLVSSFGSTGGRYRSSQRRMSARMSLGALSSVTTHVRTCVRNTVQLHDTGVIS